MNQAIKIILCADPLDVRLPDALFNAEAQTANQLGVDYYLIDFEALTNQNVGQSVRRVPQQNELTTTAYRGWMLKPSQYQWLYEALYERNLRLINDPEQYRHCHYLPASYSTIEPYTPQSVWTTHTSIGEIMPLLKIFGDKPLILKDFVKSQKHYWYEACYIPSASDGDAVQRVVSRFLELQGDDLNEGLVFREFIPFEPLAQHSKSAMPLTKEFRIFWLDGEPIYSIEYWEQGNYSDVKVPIDQFRQVAAAVQSRFFTMDVAKQVDADWMIVELGDAQVAGLPERTNLVEFYKSLLGTLRI